MGEGRKDVGGCGEVWGKSGRVYGVTGKVCWGMRGDHKM